MTIEEAIKSVDEFKSNTYSDAQKVQWLSELDGQIKVGVIDTHVGGHCIPFRGYNVQTPTSTVLLVRAPFEEIYTRWLEAKICYADGEIDGYNVAKALYNAVFSAFEDKYNSTHAPLHKGRRFIF